MTEQEAAIEVVGELYFLAYCIANDLSFRPDAKRLLVQAGGMDAVLRALSAKPRSANILPEVRASGTKQP